MQKSDHNLKPGQRLSAGVVIVHATAADEPRLLLLRAYRYWDFPKGLVEPNESPLAAARREVAEETGITTLDFAWGFTHYDTPPYARGKIARYFLALTTQTRVELQPNSDTGRSEHHEHRWVSFREASDLLSPRVQRAAQWAEQAIQK